MENAKFEFEPLGRNRKSVNRAPILGMALTIYDARYALTDKVLEALDNPETISVAYIDKMKSFIVYADPEGTDSACDTKRNQFCNKEVREQLKTVMDVDFSKYYYRINNGHHFGDCVLFCTSDLVEVERKTRNGNN